MTSFCKRGMKAAGLEPLKASLHFGCAQTDFSVLTALHIILEEGEALCCDLDCSCENLLTLHTVLPQASCLP